jgi:hypothetical protein
LTSGAAAREPTAHFSSTSSPNIAIGAIVDDDLERRAAMNPGNGIRIFRFMEEMDAFLVTDEFRQIAEYIGIDEWTPVVWIGRLFCLDNDFGEHWFDNWDLREKRATKAEAAGIPMEDLLVIDPDRFQDGVDGPCHDAEQRKRFWADVLASLELSFETVFAEARATNALNKESG